MNNINSQNPKEVFDYLFNQMFNNPYLKQTQSNIHTQPSQHTENNPTQQEMINTLLNIIRQNKPDN